MHFGYQSWVSISMSFWLNGETRACAVYAEIIFRDFRESVELRDNDNMNSDERPQDFICQRTSVKSSQKRKHFKPTRRDNSRGLLWHVSHQGTGEINTTVKIWIIAAQLNKQNTPWRHPGGFSSFRRSVVSVDALLQSHAQTETNHPSCSLSEDDY